MCTADMHHFTGVILATLTKGQLGVSLRFGWGDTAMLGRLHIGCATYF